MYELELVNGEMRWEREMRGMGEVGDFLNAVLSPQFSKGNWLYVCVFCLLNHGL